MTHWTSKRGVLQVFLQILDPFPSCRFGQEILVINYLLCTLNCNKHQQSPSAPKKQEEQHPALRGTVDKGKPISLDFYCYTTVCVMTQRKPSMYGSSSDKGLTARFREAKCQNQRTSLPRMTLQISVELWPIVAQHKVWLIIMKQVLVPCFMGMQKNKNRTFCQCQHHIDQLQRASMSQSQQKPHQSNQRVPEGEEPQALWSQFKHADAMCD